MEPLRLGGRRPSVTLVSAGVVSAVAGLLLIDAVLVAHREPREEHRFSFVLCIPIVFSLLGLLPLLLASPQDILEDSHHRAKAVLVVSWASLFLSSVTALVMTFFCFTGKQERLRASPGVELVVFTALNPIAFSLLWWSRGREVDEDDG